MGVICGIDEAGRGPVIGPMVMAGACIDESKQEKLKELGIRDSKLIRPKEREKLFKVVLGSVKSYKIITVQPEIIDDALKDPRLNLNKLEAKTTAEILNHLKPEKAVIDLPDRDPIKYERYIRTDLSFEKIELMLEYKADYNHPIAAAASILAKVTRDRYVAQIREQFGEDFGSGYMSDPKTRLFLEKHWNNKRIYFFRKEWASWKNVKKNKEQKRLFDY